MIPRNSGRTLCPPVAGATSPILEFLRLGVLVVLFCRSNEDTEKPSDETRLRHTVRQPGAVALVVSRPPENSRSSATPRAGRRGLSQGGVGRMRPGGRTCLALVPGGATRAGRRPRSRFESRAQFGSPDEIRGRSAGGRASRLALVRRSACPRCSGAPG